MWNSLFFLFQSLLDFEYIINVYTLKKFNIWYTTNHVSYYFWCHRVHVTLCWYCLKSRALGFVLFSTTPDRFWMCFQCYDLAFLLLTTDVENDASSVFFLQIVVMKALVQWLILSQNTHPLGNLRRLIDWLNFDLELIGMFLKLVFGKLSNEDFKFNDPFEFYD